MDYFNISGGAEDHYKHLHESPQYQDQIDGVEAEWQIPTLGSLPRPTQGFRNCDFRNPQTGESIIPTELYVQLQHEVHQASESYRWNFLFLIMAIQVTVLIPTFVLVGFDDVDASSSIYSQIACFAGLVLLDCFMWRTGMQWMNKSLNARMEGVVQERQGTFMDCGVKLGYFHETTWCHWNRAHVWLRRIPESQPSSTTTTNTALQESTRSAPQNIPPIFIRWLVPGDIHINEKEYDPSMVMDQEVWTMIQNAHIASFRPCNRCLAILMPLLGFIVIVYSIFVSYFLYLFGNLQVWLVWLGIMSAFFLNWYMLDRLNVKAWSQVADDVTLLLGNNENPNWNGLVLKFETSLLPFRNGQLSRRYQLVRIQENTHLLHSSAVDGKKGNGHDEYHIL